MMRKIYLICIILGTCALSLTACANGKLQQKCPETFRGTDIPLIPFRLSLPDKGSISYIDLDKDGVSGFKMDENDGFDSWLWPDMASFPSGNTGEQMRQTYGLLIQRMILDIYKENNTLINLLR